MNLYLIWQETNTGYDTYDSAVVAAESEDKARLINPAGEKDWGYKFAAWCERPDQVQVSFLCAGYEGKSGVVLASFNAG